MTTNSEILHSDGKKIPILRIPSKTSGPLLVIVPSIFGISPDVTSFANEFAEQGALVYVLDSFWRTHPGPLRIPEDSNLALARMNALAAEDAFLDLMTVINHGKSDPLSNGSILLLGICFGGKFVLQATKEQTIQGLCVWHGARLLPVLQPVSLQNTEAYLDFGEVDPLIPLEEVKIIREKLSTLPNIHIRTHPNAGHGFSHINTPKCEASAAEIARSGMLSLIKKYRS